MNKEKIGGKEKQRLFIINCIYYFDNNPAKGDRKSKS